MRPEADAAINRSGRRPGPGSAEPLAGPAAFIPAGGSSELDRSALIDRMRANYEGGCYFRTSPPAGYCAPGDAEIAAALDGKSISVSPAFFRDLANLAAGGSFTPASAWEEFIQRDLEAAGAAALSAETIGRTWDYHWRVSEFMRGIDFAAVPGATALEKTVVVLTLLRERIGSDVSDEQAWAKGDGTLWRQMINQKCGEVQDLPVEFLRLLDEENVKAPEGYHPGIKQRRKALERLLSDRILAKALAVARELDTYREMNASADFGRSASPQSSAVRMRPIKDLSELPRIPRAEWALYSSAPAYFWLKAINHEFSVRERVTDETPKPKGLRYLLVDCSGSMGQDSGGRIGVALGVVMHQLRGVLRGEDELYIRFFDYDLYEEHHVRSPEEAAQAMRMVAEKNFSGGGTNIDHALRQGNDRVNEIMAEGAHVRPELVIITDGDDRVSLTRADFGETRLHAITCLRDNSALRALASQTGGLGKNIK